MPSLKEEPEESWQLLENECPMVTVIRHRYMVELSRKWTNIRIARLTNIMRCTKEELCALCGEFKRERIAKYWEKGAWPMHLVVQFNRWEGFAQERIMGSLPTLNPDDIMVAKLLLRYDSKPRPAKMPQQQRAEFAPEI